MTAAVTTEKEKRVVVAPIFPLNTIFLSISTLTVIIISTITTLYLGNVRAKANNLSGVKFNQEVSLLQVPSNWKTYQNSDYGFSIRYPDNWTYALEGPNAAMVDLQNGKSISGTVKPTFNTIDFFNTYVDKEFSISIYPNFKSDLTTEQFENGYLYMYGSCDLRWGYNPLSTNLISINKSKLLRVVGIQKSTDSNATDTNKACFYTKNSKGNLIVLSATPTSPADDLSIYNKIISTFKTISK